MSKNIKRFLRWTLLVILIVFCIGGIITIQGAKNEVVIYSAQEDFRNKKMRDQLKEAFPEIEVNVQYITTNKGAAKLKLEKEYTDADIIVGFDIQSMELIKDIFTDLSHYPQEHYIEGLNPVHNKYRIWEKFAGAIIVDKDILVSKGVPEPSTYQDLLKPIYKDLVSMPDPKSSGTGYLFLKNLVNEWGEDRAFQYFDELYPNIKQFTQSGSGPIKLLLQKEAAIALGMTFQAVGEINEGSNLKIIYPPEGSPYSLTGIGMIKGREKNEEVKKVFEFLYNEFIYYDKEYYSPEAIFKEQVIKVPNYPENIQYSNMKGISSVEEKQRLLKRWKY